MTRHVPIVEQLLAASTDMIGNFDGEHDEWAAINDRAAITIQGLLTAVIELVAEQIKLGPFDEPLGSSEQTPAVNLGLAAIAKAQADGQ